MDLRIGIAETTQPITVTLGDDADRDALKASVEAALGAESSVLWLKDSNGREVAIASARLTYVEIAPASSNPIGFG